MSVLTKTNVLRSYLVEKLYFTVIICTAYLSCGNMNVRSMIIFAIYVTSIYLNVIDFETFNSLPSRSSLVLILVYPTETLINTYE